MGLANSSANIYRTGVIGSASAAILPQLDDRLSWLLTASGLTLLGLIVGIKLIGWGYRYWWPK